MKHPAPKATRTAVDKIRAMVAIFDLSGKYSQRIICTNTRQYLIRMGLKPAVRGGPLMVGEHEIVLLSRAKRSATPR